MTQEVKVTPSPALGTPTDRTAGDLLLRALDAWMPHANECGRDECLTCDLLINRLRLAYKVWQNSAYKAFAPAADLVGGEWRRAALLKDRTRRAIRERLEAGDTAALLAHDYDVPVEFVEFLRQWQLFGDAAPPVLVPERSSGEKT